LKYGTIISLQKQLKDVEELLAKKASSSSGSGSKLLKEEVTEADIAEIISKWTGAFYTQAVQTSFPSDWT
jgi:ATP-dependent Clp protease ATP-binding subunit ClpB